MPYALNLVLDPQASLEIERISASLSGHAVADHDLTTQYGHCVTLMIIADGVHEDDIGEILARLVPDIGALPILFTGPCVMPGAPPTLCLRVGLSDDLLAAHQVIFAALPERAVHLHYRPPSWQPHLKLANVRGRGQSKSLVASLCVGWRDLTGTLSAVEVIQYPPAQAIWQAPLKHRERWTGPAEAGPAQGD